MKNGLIIDQFSTKCWYKDDLLHNENGPAIEYFGGVEVTEKEVMNRWNAMQEKKLLEDSTESNNKLTKRLKL